MGAVEGLDYKGSLSSKLKSTQGTIFLNDWDLVDTSLSKATQNFDWLYNFLPTRLRFLPNSTEATQAHF